VQYPGLIPRLLPAADLERWQGIGHHCMHAMRAY
jgi:hypothetical protein